MPSLEVRYCFLLHFTTWFEDPSQSKSNSYSGSY